MASGCAVRFVMGKQPPRVGALRLQLRVKPGASRDRQGVCSVTDECVELCVAARARDGEANEAVVRLLSDVIGVPKSRLRMSHGAKSRDKTVTLGGVMEDDGPAFAEAVLQRLRQASGR